MRGPEVAKHLTVAAELSETCDVLSASVSEFIYYPILRAGETSA